MAPSAIVVTDVRINEGALRRLTRSRVGPIGQDLQRRGIRVTRRMKENASGRPGPEIRTSNLYSAISLISFEEDAEGLFVKIGPQTHRMIRRGYNYALILEGIFPRGGAPPDGAYPFIERSLEAARD